jgi:hypothetical protein
MPRVDPTPSGVARPIPARLRSTINRFGGPRSLNSGKRRDDCEEMCDWGRFGKHFGAAVWWSVAARSAFMTAGATPAARGRVDRSSDGSCGKLEVLFAVGGRSAPYAVSRATGDPRPWWLFHICVVACSLISSCGSRRVAASQPQIRVSSPCNRSHRGQRKRTGGGMTVQAPGSPEADRRQDALPRRMSYGTREHWFHRCAAEVGSREQPSGSGVGSISRTRTGVRHDGEPIRS